MQKKPHILVAGAGIAGLTAALALLRRGIDVDVHEQASGLGEVGAGVQLGPNGTRVLYDLGIGDEVGALASRPDSKELRVWNTGAAYKLFDVGRTALERFGFPYLTVYRPDLHKVLVDAVRREKPDAIHLSSRATGVRQNAFGVELELDGGRTVHGDALAAADGVHSAIRASLAGPERARFSGCLAWRGVIPAQALPAHLARPVGMTWIGPGGHVVHYPLRSGKYVNFVGCIERDDWQVESWTEQGSREECLRDFAGWHDDVRTLIGSIDTPYKWALLVRDPLPRWSYGRVTMMGDACHPTLPFLAQGANMAIEDGMVLARAVAARPADPAAAFRTYEQARQERTTRIVRGAAANATRFHNDKLEDPVTAAQYIASEWDSRSVHERYDWLFRYDAVSVALES